MIDLDILKLNDQKLKNYFQAKLPNLDLIKEVKILNTNYKEYLHAFETLKHQQKQLSNQIRGLTEVDEIKQITHQSQVLKKKIITIQKNCIKMRSELLKKMLFIPNIPDDEVINYENDKVIKQFGVKKKIKHSYLTILQKYGWVDWTQTANLSGTRFVSYLDKGAKLRRALINFMLDFHSSRGFIEISTPLLVNAHAVLGTGNLPKFKNDLYETKDNKYLIPTAEVTLTNFFANKIFQISDLPLRLTQFSSCFRKEAGAAGNLNRGLMRLHQFNKVELVKITHPSQSNLELNNMVFNVEQILQKLKIPYQVKLLAAKNLGFAAAKTFDLEVWMPSEGQYREISSCSNCKTFQSRRIKLKFKDKDGKNKYLHTLNGSGVAIDRLFATVLENWQNSTGIIKIPRVLHKYFSDKTLL